MHDRANNKGARRCSMIIKRHTADVMNVCACTHSVLCECANARARAQCALDTLADLRRYAISGMHIRATSLALICGQHGAHTSHHTPGTHRATSQIKWLRFVSFDFDDVLGRLMCIHFYRCKLYDYHYDYNSCLHVKCGAVDLFVRP